VLKQHDNVIIRNWITIVEIRIRCINIVVFGGKASAPSVLWLRTLLINVTWLDEHERAAMACN